MQENYSSVCLSVRLSVCLSVCLDTEVPRLSAKIVGLHCLKCVHACTNKGRGNIGN